MHALTVDRPLRPIRWVQRIDERLFAPGREDALALLRVGFAMVILVRTVTWPFAALAGTPAALFNPPPPLWWMHTVPSAPTLVAMQVAGAFAATAAIVQTVRGRRPSFLLIAWLAFFVLAGVKTSMGKVLHNDVLVLLCSLPVVVSAAPASLRSKRVAPLAGWPVRSSLLTMTVVYFLCGAQKVRHSGLDWVFSSNMRWILEDGIESHRAPTNALSTILVQHPAVCVGAAASLLALELTFPVVLLVPRARTPYAISAALLHTVTWLTLGLDYWSWALTALLVVAATSLVAPGGGTRSLATTEALSVSAPCATPRRLPPLTRTSP